MPATGRFQHAKAVGVITVLGSHLSVLNDQRRRERATKPLIVAALTACASGIVAQIRRALLRDKDGHAG
ncbi:MAG: hypothetical protein QGH15_04070 [Kiritimatiellia bacterium]|nr:hypothetical protein [Kiritimatiellia bacterium]